MNSIPKITKSLACVVVFVAVVLIGCGPREETAKQVWLYEWRGVPRMVFNDATIYEARAGYIKFKATWSGKETIIEHSGRYDVEH